MDERNRGRFAGSRLVPVATGIGCLVVDLLALASLADEMWRQADCFGTCVPTGYWLVYRFAPFIEVAIVLVFAAFLSSRRVSLRVGVWCTVILVSLFVVVDLFAGAGAIFSII